ncbi:lactonase family protein [Flavihumibacter fluvii]|uniref:lactonase family protein n=1 Tax=Flavihumibacter fluvii TaxID=2838157 RepID=UPI001EFA348B|nr:lactonase family protein [Flavihumibacter fluvii]ULQ53695.1 lactonase family protein [Flavihumibacter fluvii]
MLLITAILCYSASQAQQYYLFVGTYTKGKSEGIYVYRFDGITGTITPVDTAKNIENPSYLAVSNDGKFVYAVNENGGTKPGQLSAFSFDQQLGKLTLMNQKESKGDYPCYITISSNRKWVIAGNYGGGNLAAYATNANGSLSDIVQVINHSGNSINKDRQESAHVHSTIFTKDNKYLLVPDLGIDKVMTYQFNASAKSEPLKTAPKPFTSITAGSGPRHLSFHPNGKWVYLIEELSGKVSAWLYKEGSLKLFQEVDAHPTDFKGERGSADIHVSPDGKHLYASNRGDANNLAIFSIDPSTGKLSTKGFQDVLGKTPRNFIIEPSGNFVLVANQESNDIRIFRRNTKTGLLTPTSTVIQVGNPVCLQLLSIPRE